MPLSMYNRDIPDGPNNPSADQPKMKTNTNSIDELISVDHFSFNDQNGGFHRIIHEVPQGSWNPVTRTGNPAGTPGLNEIVSLLYLPDSTGAVVDTQLFNVTGNNGISQLTGSLSTQDGYQWVGGVLLQWGVVALPAIGNPAQGIVTFKDRVAGAIPFPLQCFNVQATLISKVGGTGTQPRTLSIILNSVSNTGFTWNIDDASTAYPFFFWFAIGQ